MEEAKVKKVLFNEVSFIIAIIGCASSIIFWVINPQHNNDIAIQLMEERIIGQRKTIDELTLTSQNDIKETKNELVGLRVEIQNLNSQVVKLQTILEERIPRPIK